MGQNSCLRRAAAALLEQQLWCWGRDIARPDGSVFARLGLCRHRCPPGVSGCTAYTGLTRGGDTVWLWGFGLLYHSPGRGGVFLRRFRFDPLLADARPVLPAHRVADLCGLTRPASAAQRELAATLVRAAAGWVAEYEHWVAEELGTAYRAATLAARPKPPAVPAAGVAAAWERLAKKSARLTRQRNPLGGVRGMLLAVLQPRPIPTNTPRLRHA